MDVLQSWVIVGVPALIGIGALFTGNSQRRALLGYGLLGATIAFFVIVPGDVLSTALFSVIAFTLVAAGRGTHLDAETPEHHENRKRFTTDPSHP